MTARDFCYWLQGMFELGDPENIPAVQTKAIKNHLAMVFKHEIDPSMGPPPHQDLLKKIHSGGTGLDLKLNC